MKIRAERDEEENNEKLVRGLKVLTPLMLMFALVGSALAGAPIFVGYVTSAVAVGLLSVGGMAAVKKAPWVGALFFPFVFNMGEKWAHRNFIPPMFWERYDNWFWFQWIAIVVLSAFAMAWSYERHLQARRPGPPSST